MSEEGDIIEFRKRVGPEKASPETPGEIIPFPYARWSIKYSDIMPTGENIVGHEALSSPIGLFSFIEVVQPDMSVEEQKEYREKLLADAAIVFATNALGYNKIENVLPEDRDLWAERYITEIQYFDDLSNIRSQIPLERKRRLVRDNAIQQFRSQVEAGAQMKEKELKLFIKNRGRLRAEENLGIADADITQEDEQLISAWAQREENYLRDATSKMKMGHGNRYSLFLDSKSYRSSETPTFRVISRTSNGRQNPHA